jgi:pimeloyl-ACP methyl ester carboxylesterase
MKQIMILFSIALLVLVRPTSAQQESSFKHLIDIGSGRHLNMICVGKGSPTVVFLQGHTGNITDWRMVRGPVSAFTRSCFYDRAGMGFSDPSTKSMTAENVADDLHALLRAAKIEGPVVLVGHSLGGLFATFYADKFPSTLAGLVLVDPSFSGQFDYMVGPNDRKIITQDNDHWDSLLMTCEKLAQADQLSKDDNHDCFHAPTNLTPEETDYVTSQFYRPSYYASLRSEYENFDVVKGAAPPDGEQERRLAHPFGNMPLEVLTAELTFSGATVSGTGRKTIEAVWRSGHDKLAQRSKRGESIMIANSHHFIQLDQPDAVVSAIRKVVLEARQ